MCSRRKDALDRITIPQDAFSPHCADCIAAIVDHQASSPLSTVTTLQRRPASLRAIAVARSFASLH
jgi:hypothetical protein